MTDGKGGEPGSEEERDERRLQADLHERDARVDRFFRRIVMLAAPVFSASIGVFLSLQGTSFSSNLSGQLVLMTTAMAISIAFLGGGLVASKREPASEAGSREPTSVPSPDLSPQGVLLLMRQRLTVQIDSLARRGTYNLAIGGMATLGVVGIFGFAVGTSPFRTDGPLDWSHVATYYVPRAALAVTMELFAFFFLRLYRNGSQEIRYLHNELTAIELKWMAFNASLTLPDASAAKDAVVALIHTERNLVLKHGESTVEIERLKVERSLAQETLVTVERLLGSVQAKATVLADAMNKRPGA